MKIVFIGCVAIALKCLKQIIKDGWEVEAIFTLAKKYAAKTSGFVNFSPIAKRYRISLYKVKDLNTSLHIKRIKKINPDLIMVCGWQRLICKEILNVPSKGTVGFHSSLLPKYRGRAPVNWAIINNEKRSGVTMFYCTVQPDAGNIIAQEIFPINISDTCATVYDKAAKGTCILVHKFLPKISKETVRRIKNKSISHKLWPRRKPEAGRINWNRNALDVYNWIRALTHPYPGAFTFYKGKKIFVWKSVYKNRIKNYNFNPGEIVKVIKKRGSKLLRVATLDKCIDIFDLTNERKQLVKDFSKGERFN